MVMSPTAGFDLAQRLRSPDGVPLADVFSFVSGLYFRGKVAYARRFAQPPDPAEPVSGGGVLVSSSQQHATQRSLAHGNCARAGERKYTCTFVWFRFDPAGTFVGMQRVRRTMTISQAQ